MAFLEPFHERKCLLALTAILVIEKINDHLPAGSDERRSDMSCMLPFVSEGTGPGDSADTIPDVKIMSTRRITGKKEYGNLIGHRGALSIVNTSYLCLAFNTLITVGHFLFCHHGPDAFIGEIIRGEGYGGYYHSQYGQT